VRLLDMSPGGLAVIEYLSLSLRDAAHRNGRQKAEGGRYEGDSKRRDSFALRFAYNEPVMA
jgi:hypothetical protein